MTTAVLPSAATETQATEATRTITNLYGKLACGHGTPGLYVQVLGIGAGKNAGQPAVAAMQNSTSAHGDWQSAYLPLTGATAPATLVDLTVCAGYNATEGVGLGSDGNIYLVGEQTEDKKWTAGAGMLTQNDKTTFLPGTLSSCLLNTTTILAISSGNVPCVAAYRDEKQVWQPGYPLISPIISVFQSVAARPDLSSAGTVHAIGLTGGGHACEVATASGSGTGKSNWKAGHGYLGSKTGLPSFAQLLLVSGDAAMNFHVIGLGTDGSVWDIDTYSAGADTPKWSGTSTRIFAEKTIAGSKIDFFLSGAPGSFTINLVAWAGSTLKIVACFDQAWTTSNAEIPVSGTSAHWHIVNNLADTTSSGIFILGLSGLGLIYELAYSKDGTWTAGSTKPISG
jgi:hypothetical protein